MPGKKKTEPKKAPAAKPAPATKKTPPAKKKPAGKKKDEEETGGLPDVWRPERDNPSRPPQAAVYRLGYIRPDNTWIPASVTLTALGYSDVMELLSKPPARDNQERTPVLVRTGGEGDAILYKWQDADKEWVRV